MPARAKPVVIPSRVPARLRALVEQDGRPQTEIADAIGWSKQRLYRAIAGTSSPTAETIAAILAGLGRSWADLD